SPWFQKPSGTLNWLELPWIVAPGTSGATCGCTPNLAWATSPAGIRSTEARRENDREREPSMEPSSVAPTVERSIRRSTPDLTPSRAIARANPGKIPRIAGAGPRTIHRSGLPSAAAPCSRSADRRLAGAAPPVSRRQLEADDRDDEQREEHDARRRARLAEQHDAEHRRTERPDPDPHGVGRADRQFALRALEQHHADRERQERQHARQH